MHRPDLQRHGLPGQVVHRGDEVQDEMARHQPANPGLPSKAPSLAAPSHRCGARRAARPCWRAVAAALMPRHRGRRLGRTAGRGGRAASLSRGGGCRGHSGGMAHPGLRPLLQTLAVGIAQHDQRHNQQHATNQPTRRGGGGRKGSLDGADCGMATSGEHVASVCQHAL
jgi:hypothetical protein